MRRGIGEEGKDVKRKLGKWGRERERGKGELNMIQH